MPDTRQSFKGPHQLVFTILVFSYNISKSAWNELPRLTPERGYHGLAIIDGEMFVIGGVTSGRGEGREGNNVEMLDTG